jgi:two-component system NtrC family sensor kinase
VIYLDHRISQGVFREEQKQLIEALSQQAAVALDRVALYQERERLHQEALAQARSELAETQAQLLNTSKLAAVGELAAGVAHEVNNPLCALAVNLEALNKKITDVTLKRRLSIMDRAVERCRHVVDKLLTFTHPSRTQWGECSLDEIVKQTVELMSFQLRDIDLILELEPTTVSGEPSALGQVVLNLLGNAKDAVAETKEAKRIKIFCGRENGVSCLRVGDNGCGMDEVVRKRIFEPFFTTKPVGSGSGLGLSVSYQILKQHQALIEVESELGEGTIFTIRFAAAESEANVR